MAATAHSDPYAIFMRKIGYSVGLDLTAARVEDLVTRYLQDRDLTMTSWRELVTGSKNEGSWGLNESAVKNIGDFFCSLRLILRASGDILILENLDAMAICIELLDEEERKEAQDFLLLWAILVNDGEIFVNLLLANFEDKQAKETLRAMMLQKRADLSGYLLGKASARQINRVIMIERQEKNKGSAGVGRSVASLKRAQPLQYEKVSVRASEKGDEIEFSDDYFSKVPKVRKRWAVSLGLWDNKMGLTQRGRDFLFGLRRAGYVDDDDRFTFWPMDYELVRSGFKSDLFGKDTKSLWTCLVEYGTAYSSLSVKPHVKGDEDLAVEFIGEMMKVFRSLHVRKVMLRRELPITIVYPAAVAIACARGKSVINLPAAISTEQMSEQRRIALRRSRKTGGALSIKR